MKNATTVIRCRDTDCFFFASLRKFLPVAVVLRRKNDCTWVRARGNQLIHRTAVREHPPPLTLSSSFDLILLVLLIVRDDPRLPRGRTLSLSPFLSLFLSLMRVYENIS